MSSDNDSEEEDMLAVGEVEMLKISDVARILNVEKSTVRRWIKEGALPAIVLPHKSNQKRNAYRIKRSDINKTLRNNA